MVHLSLSFHLCYWNPGDEVEWRRNRRVVEEWTVLGDRWCLSTSLCRFPGPSESACWNWHQLHCDLQGLRWRWRLCWALHVQMDNPSDPPHNPSHNKHGRGCCWHLLCHQQWLPVMGTPLWQALLCILGHHPSLPFPQRSHGAPEQNTNHCGGVVHSSCIHFLSAVGENWSFHHKGHWPWCWRVWY